MAQNNRFDIVISAVDRASKPIAKINREMERMLRPVKQLERSTKNLARNLHLDKAARGLSGFAKMAERFGVSNPAVAGLAGGIGMAAFATMLAKLTTSMATNGAVVQRLTQRTGVGGRSIQRYRGAAQLMGLNKGMVDSGLTALSGTMRNAQYDPELAMLFNRMGVKPVMKQDGTPDVAAMLPKIADWVSSQKNPETAAAVLDRMGIGELFPMLRDGSKTLEAFAAQADKAGIVLGDDVIKSATEFDRSMSLLKSNVEGFGNQFAQELMPAFKGGIDWINNQFKKDDTKDPGFLENPLSPLKWMSDAFDLGAAMGAPYAGEPARRKVSGRIIDEVPGSGPFKLNNPGNLRMPGGKGFQRFASTQAGLTAMASQLGLYFNRDNLNTISGIVSKYAPPTENPTGAYIANVAQRTGFGANQQLNMNDPATLGAVMQAMLVQEQGKSGGGISAKEIGEAVAAALKGVTLNAKVQGGLGARVAFAMPSDGVR